MKLSIRAMFDGAIEKIRKADAAERDKIELTKLARGLERAVVDFTTSGIDNFIQTTYLDVVAELKLDIRIFAGCNFVAFLLLLFSSFARRDAIDLLFVPGLLLGAAVAFCTWCYVFNQDWLWTIVYGSYVGYAYLLGLSVVFMLLLDIVLNKARFTMKFIGHSFGIPVYKES
jgi:hypothetical protein